MKMTRVQYHLTTQQVAALKEISKKTGIRVAELIRRAVDLLLQKEGE